MTLFPYTTLFRSRPGRELKRDMWSLSAAALNEGPETVADAASSGPAGNGVAADSRQTPQSGAP
jgi:hypothetical protein